MPPAPTDLLAEDVRELRESQQRLAARMEGQETAFREMREEFLKFRARIKRLSGNKNQQWQGVTISGLCWQREEGRRNPGQCK